MKGVGVRGGERALVGLVFSRRVLTQQTFPFLVIGWFGGAVFETIKQCLLQLLYCFVYSRVIAQPFMVFVGGNEVWV